MVINLLKNHNNSQNVMFEVSLMHLYALRTLVDMGVFIYIVDAPVKGIVSRCPLIDLELRNFIDIWDYNIIEIINNTYSPSFKNPIN